MSKKFYGRGIACGVLSTPTISTLVFVLQNQHVEEPIKSLRYLIGVTGHGTSMLPPHVSQPLPRSKLIFLYKDRDIRSWLLANPGNDPLNLLVLETRQGTDEGRAETLAPGSGRHQSFDPNVWHRIGSAESVDDDIDTEGNGTYDSDDYKDEDFDDTIIVDDEVASALSLVPNARSGEDHNEV